MREITVREIADWRCGTRCLELNIAVIWLLSICSHSFSLRQMEVSYRNLTLFVIETEITYISSILSVRENESSV